MDGFTSTVLGHDLDAGLLFDCLCQDHSNWAILTASLQTEAMRDLYWLQGLKIVPASFVLTAGAGANASVAGVVDVSAASTVPDLFTYVAEVAVNSSYVVSGASISLFG